MNSDTLSESTFLLNSEINTIWGSSFCAVSFFSLQITRYQITFQFFSPTFCRVYGNNHTEYFGNTPLPLHFSFISAMGLHPIFHLPRLSQFSLIPKCTGGSTDRGSTSQHEYLVIEYIQIPAIVHEQDATFTENQ